MKVEENFSLKNKISKKLKLRVSKCILTFASILMLATIVLLIQKSGQTQIKPSRQPMLSQLKAISKIPDTSKNQKVPMTAENLDFDECLDQVGQIKVEKVGLSLPIVKGRGKEDGTGFDKAIYACTNKKNQVLGVNNYVLSAHSDYQSATRCFSPLLVYEDGSFDLTRECQIEQLKLKVGDTIDIDQDQIRYTFKISSMVIDEGQSNFLKTYQAMADVIGQPQVTLYTCVDIAGEKRLVIQANNMSKTHFSS